MDRPGYTEFTFSYGGMQRRAYISIRALSQFAKDDSVLGEVERKLLIELHQDKIEEAARRAAQRGEEPDGTVTVSDADIRSVLVA